MWSPGLAAPRRLVLLARNPEPLGRWRRHVECALWDRQACCVDSRPVPASSHHPRASRRSGGGGTSHPLMLPAARCDRSCSEASASHGPCVSRSEDAREPLRRPWVKPWNPSRASPGPRSLRPGAQPAGNVCSRDLWSLFGDNWTRCPLCCTSWPGSCHLLGSHPPARG